MLKLRKLKTGDLKERGRNKEGEVKVQSEDKGRYKRLKPEELQ